MLTSEEVQEIINTFSDDAWEWPMKRRANRKVVQALLKDRAEMQAEIARLRAVADAAREVKRLQKQEEEHDKAFSLCAESGAMTAERITRENEWSTVAVHICCALCDARDAFDTALVALEATDEG